MKIIGSSIILLFFVLSVKAQTTDTLKKNVTPDHVFANVERAPEYTGGISQFYKFLAKYMRYPAEARENGTSGRVLVTMVVEKDGSLSDVKVVRGIGDGCDDEAVRLVKLSSPWQPGIQNGCAVRVMYTVPIVFDLSGQ